MCGVRINKRIRSALCEKCCKQLSYVSSEVGRLTDVLFMYGRLQASMAVIDKMDGALKLLAEIVSHDDHARDGQSNVGPELDNLAELIHKQILVELTTAMEEIDEVAMLLQRHAIHAGPAG